VAVITGVEEMVGTCPCVTAILKLWVVEADPSVTLTVTGTEAAGAAGVQVTRPDGDIAMPDGAVVRL
jgi:hypothetical protein